MTCGICSTAFETKDKRRKYCSVGCYRTKRRAADQAEAGEADSMTATGAGVGTVRVAYADPPYPGCAGYYPEKTEVDHAELIARLERDFDGWLLHTHSNALRDLLPLCPKSARLMAWVKPFAAFKKNVSVAYAWEPVIVKAARKPSVSGRAVMRDWIAASSTLKKGLCGAKPLDVCLWAFEVLGMEPSDELVDLYPGTGAVTQAWAAFCAHAWGRDASTIARGARDGEGA